MMRVAVPAEMASADYRGPTVLRESHITCGCRSQTSPRCRTSLKRVVSSRHRASQDELESETQ